LVAKLVASLDRVSAGRFDLGVGVGGEYPPEFDAVGVAMSQRGTRTDETLRLMSALFAGGPVDFVGEFVRIKALIMEPAPVQRPGPPVWVGGRSERSMRRAAEFGDVWLPYLVTPDQLAAGVVKIGQLTGGRRRVRAGVYCWAAVDPNGDVARRTAQQVVGELYGQDFSSMSRYLLAGDPGEVISRVSQYVAAGTEELVFAPACPEEHVDAMVDRFAADVLPTIRALGPRREVNV
jgi:alkanesulfonate monooxygenase SsuD/methylene tetrahydromethanopterin reductase-like flavin-dependent oxidoreductase (luciferase family)